MCQAVCTHFGEHVTPMQTRQAEIQDNCIGGMRVEVIESANAVFDCNDFVAFSAEGGSEHRARLKIIFNDKNNYGVDGRRTHSRILLRTFFRPQTELWHERNR